MSKFTRNIDELLHLLTAKKYNLVVYLKKIIRKMFIILLNPPNLKIDNMVDKTK